MSMEVKKTQKPCLYNNKKPKKPELMEKRSQNILTEYYLLRKNETGYARVFPCRDPNLIVKVVFGAVLEQIIVGHQSQALLKIFDFIEAENSQA